MEILLAGAGGFLGSYVLHVANALSSNTVTALRLGGATTPLTSPCREIHATSGISVKTLSEKIGPNHPTHILHIGALSTPAACERDSAAAFTSNFELTKILTDYAASIGAHITFTSTDLVFDGGKAPPGGLQETDSPTPLSQYARSKLNGESAVLTYERGCVVRLSLLYGHAPSPAKGVLGWMEKAFKNHEPLPLFHDEFRTPLHVADATQALIEAATQALTGVWHCGGPDRMSRVEFGQRVAAALGYDTTTIRATSRTDINLSPARPEDVSLNSAKLTERLSFTAQDVTSALTLHTEWR